MSGSAAAVLTKPAFRKIEWLARDIAVERRPDGVIILKSRIPLQPYEKHIPASLAKWAKQAPERTWLAQRGGADRQWRKVSYGEAKRTVDGLTQGLLNLGLDRGRPVAILSGNSIEHALMTQAAMQARLPAAPVSPAYSLMSQDHLKLKYLFDLIKPAVVMVQDGPTFEKALEGARSHRRHRRACRASLRRHQERVLCRSRRDAGDESGRGIRSRRLRPIPSASCCSRRARPACPRPSSTPRR